MADSVPAPFTCQYSPNLPEILYNLNCTIAISTYQAGKVIFISAPNKEDLVQLPRNFPKAMGIAVKGNKMAIAVKEEVIELACSEQLARTYPPKPGVYDGLYLPRVSYYTGQLDLHDLEWGNDGLWAVNTRFSCLSLIDNDFSFKPVWKPNFISSLTPDDKCHLNGMTFVNGKPKYVTALGQTDTPEGWRENKIKGGVLMDVDNNEILVHSLPMPHSPRIYDGELYSLLSATGELIKYDLNKANYEVLNCMEGFVRGMAKHGDYLFIGLSRLRKKSSSFRDLPIASKSERCGIVFVHFPSASIVGHILYQASVEELYDVKILPGLRRPNVLSTMKDDFRRALITPMDTYWAQINEKETKS
jgi:uncharacterized protein (TIGR03032 family)